MALFFCLIGLFSCVELEEAENNPDNCLSIAISTKLQTEFLLGSRDEKHRFSVLLDGIAPGECGRPFERCLKKIEYSENKVSMNLEFDPGDRPGSIDIDLIEIMPDDNESTRVSVRDQALTWQSEILGSAPLNCQRVYNAKTVITE